MELLTPAFVILLVKVAICVLPGVLGIYLIATPEESKRRLRAYVCRQLFGVSNAFEYKKFASFMAIVGVLCILFAGVASWFLLLKRFF